MARLERNIQPAAEGSHNITGSGDQEPGSENQNLENLNFRWTKGEQLGRHVYLGQICNTGGLIAVKQIEYSESQRDDRTETMIRELKAEANVLEKIGHKNIVTYIGCEIANNRTSLFFEYVDGFGSIEDYIKEHGRLKQSMVKSTAHQVLKGLVYLHDIGIIHRDIRSSHVLVDVNGNCKISGFAISKSLDDPYQNHPDLSLVGTIFWLAPEVISNTGEGYSAKVDIWSLGCLVLEMLSGRRPWGDEEATQVMFLLGSERLSPLIPQDIKLTKRGLHFLKTCFSIDPQGRPTAKNLLLHKFLNPEIEREGH